MTEKEKKPTMSVPRPTSSSTFISSQTPYLLALYTRKVNGKESLGQAPVVGYFKDERSLEMVPAVVEGSGKVIPVTELAGWTFKALSWVDTATTVTGGGGLIDQFFNSTRF